MRNAGADEASGEFLIFVDADTQVSTSVVHEAIQAMTNGHTWGTAMATTYDRCPLWARIGLAAFNFYYVRWRKFAYGFFFFIHRDAFHEVEGFPESTDEGEDMADTKNKR